MAAEKDFSEWVFVALGSNLGASAENLERAIRHLAPFSDRPILRSSFWKTAPVDCPPGSPPFYNAVIGLYLAPDQTPEKFLEQLHSVEWAFGRRLRLKQNEPRPLDLDLIAFRSEQRRTADLTLPHPRAHQRKFVLAPLSEIAPHLVLPGQTESIATLLQNLKSNEVVERIP